MFVDTATVFIKSGDGGRGCVSFRREKYKPKGGPDGGDGGDGGNVTFVGDAGMNSLVRFRYSPRLVARNGGHGKGANRSGKQGEDVLVKVPCGTIVRHAETQEMICEITRAGVQETVARGGRGGKGNQHFATSTRQAPRFSQDGQAGVAFRAVLELKVMADVGLVGLPNAGKSSLISAVSNATPKVADYPFTTLDPVVGVINLPDYRTLVLADIPGIIRGASHGRGLGLRFLKHVERTKVLLYVVDVSPYATVPSGRAFDVVQGEIRAFGRGLEEKQFVIAANKADLDADRSALDRFVAGLPEGLAGRVFPVSAVTGEGLDRLIGQLDKTVHRCA